MTTATLTTRNEPRQVEDNFFKVGNTCYTLADKISTVEVTKYTSDYRAETVYVVRLGRGNRAVNCSCDGHRYTKRPCRHMRMSDKFLETTW
jgi:hypothetical protein